MQVVSETVHETSEIVKTILRDIGWSPLKTYHSEDGSVFFIWNEAGRYADIECYPNGEVLWGVTDFNQVNDVGDLDLNISSIMELRRKYESL